LWEDPLLKIARRHLLFASLAGATALAACSSDKPTGPSSGSLARLFDSAFVADTPGGHTFDLRPQIEQALALTADEGLTPITVQLTTTTGTLSMQMMALTFYDTTATGTPSDSTALVVGWTSDYKEYVALDYSVTTDNGPPAQRISVTGRFPGLTLPISRSARSAHAEAALSANDGFGFVVDGDSSAQSDSSAGNITWSGASGHCAWQHVVIAREPADSTLACSRAIVTTNFTLFFPMQPGVDASLTQVSMSSRAIPAVRLVGLN
jgi:hypothetical protein